MRIPTSRDIGRDSLRSGRIAPSGPVTNVGAAMANLGQSIVQSAFNIKDLQEREALEARAKTGNDVSTALTRFLNDEEQRFIKARDESSESGIGFTRQYIEGYQKRADDFAKSNFGGLGDDDQTRFNNSILARGNSLYEKANAYETAAKSTYYDRTTGQNLDLIRTSIKGNGAPFDDLKQQGLAAIDSADMPEPWKAERRAAWEADAAESQWQWKFQNAPQEAIDELRGVSGVDPILSAMEEVESQGDASAVSPAGAIGVMQVMPDTAEEISREIGDKAFPTGGTSEEIQTYLKDPAVSRVYGEHYFNKMMVRYGGDREAALVAYNGGPTRADAWVSSGRDDSVLPKETREYYKKVIEKAATNTFTKEDVSKAKVFLLGKTDKDASHVDGMNDGFAVKLSKLIQSAPPEFRDALGFISGARSNSRQAELYAAALKKYGSEAEARKWVAPPGKSQHNTGKAADLSYNGKSLADAPENVVKWLHENAPAFGLKFPLANENWHVEDASTRGGKAAPGNTPTAAIPYDRRQQLLGWAETEQSQRQTVERQKAKDTYSLMIATNPNEVREEVILRDGSLDNGDKASLITSLHTAMKETGAVNSFMSALSAGNASVNVMDPEETKVADNAYEKFIGSVGEQDAAGATAAFVTQSGYIPKKMQAELRQGAESSDATGLLDAYRMADRMQAMAPTSFAAMPGGEKLRKGLDLYRTYTKNLGFSDEEAAKRLVSLNDPESLRRRESVLGSEVVKKELESVSADNVAALFDTMALGDRPSVGGFSADVSGSLQVGFNSDAQAVIVDDYRASLREALADTNGDMDAARKVAADRFKRVYGPSEATIYGPRVVVRNPVELTYPAGMDGSHAYLMEQAKAGLKDDGIAAETIYLQPDQQTERDIEAGRPPRYRVLYEKDGRIELSRGYFFGDPSEEMARIKSEGVVLRNEAETRMVESRDREIRDAEAVKRAMNQTTGPDWMKAKAAETAIEKQRMDRAVEDQRKAREKRNAPVIGGGW